MADWIPIVAGGLLALGLTSLAVRRSRRGARRRALRELADALGWKFQAAMDTRHRERYAAFDVFQDGVGGHARDTLWGGLLIDGLEFPAKAGDFLQMRPERGAPRAWIRRHFSFLAVHFPFADARTLRITPTARRGGPAPGEPLGDGELAFERGDFLRAFAVECSDPALPARLLDAEVQALLHATGSRIQVVAGRLCIADGSGPWSPEQFRAHMRVAGELLERWPRPAR